MTAPSTIDALRAALLYANLQYAVFPCAPGRKTPMTGHGLLDATTDSERITRWWTRHPRANVAIRTDGLVVVDVDGDRNTWLHNEPERLSQLDSASLALTPRGGRHYFFRQPDGRSWRNTAGRLADHVDTRADGGYVLVAPSIVDSKGYRWEEGRELAVPRSLLPEPPPWLIDSLDALTRVAEAGTELAAPNHAAALTSAGYSIRQGQRNDTLTHLAGSMRRVGMSQAEIAAGLHQVNADRCAPPLDSGEVDRIAASVARYEPDQGARALAEGHSQPLVDAPATPPLVIVRLSDVEPQIQPYLWRGRIPSASSTLIGGKQGCTKNLFAYDVIARVTTGSAWPDEPRGLRREPQQVILLEAEEHLESSIVPRIVAAGADPSRVHFVKGAPTQNPDRTRLISIQSDAERIESLVRRLGDVGLVVVSPVTSYLGTVEQNSNEQVRNEIIHPLKTLAETVGCAVVILKHPNKDWKNADPLERIGGSAAWTETMRCVVFIGTDPDEPVDEKNPRRCAHWIKFSIGPTPDPISWKIYLADSGAPAIYYLSDPITFSATEMLVGRRKCQERKSKRECAAEWITKTLETGPTTAAAFNDAAMAAVERDRQFSMDAFERARKDMRDAGRLALERKPETNPAEWWYWLTGRPAPEWHTRDADPTSADPSRAWTPTHAEVAVHEEMNMEHILKTQVIRKLKKLRKLSVSAPPMFRMFRIWETPRAREEHGAARTLADGGRGRQCAGALRGRPLGRARGPWANEPRRGYGPTSPPLRWPWDGVWGVRGAARAGGGSWGGRPWERRRSVGGRP